MTALFGRRRGLAGAEPEFRGCVGVDRRVTTAPVGLEWDTAGVEAEEPLPDDEDAPIDVDSPLDVDGVIDVDPSLCETP